jgi:hypothetical protein
MRKGRALATSRRTLYHYTSAEGFASIMKSRNLRPSLKSVNPRDARHGDGQYLSDIAPASKTPGRLAYALLNDPRGWRRFTHYVEIDVSGLTVVEARPGVLLVPNTEALDLTGRILGGGAIPTAVR